MQFLAHHCSDDCYLKDQKHGDIFSVPTGHPHAVVNIKPCFKLAIDRCLRSDAHKVALVRETIGVPFFGPRMPRDYIRIADKVAKYIDRGLATDML